MSAVFSVCLLASSFDTIFTVTLALADEPSAASALEVIESSRGGRHWADAKTAPPLEPSESLDRIQIEPGYSIHLFAAEPLVQDPVAIAFDQAGRMFVAQYSDYPIGPPAGEPPLSKIVMLTDTDADGRADQRTVFADKLNFAHSMMAYRGGMLVGAQTQVLFLKDTDGDDVADVRQVLFDGFKPAHAQMQIGNPRWGLDNRVYLNYGPGKVSSSNNPDEKIDLPRKDFWFDPRTLQFGSDGGLGQFGNTIDRWGRRFYCTNRNPIMTTFLTPSDLARNPFHIVQQSHYDVAESGGETRVYPLVEMKSNYLSHAGTHTAACGTTAYIGEFGDESFASSVFVCEPIGHLVTRSIIRQEGIRLTADRAREHKDFVAATDTWFRPSSLATGPDGALYLADMYRLWVEHPKFLPPEIAAKLDWRAGDDRGRIYRIVPNNWEPKSFTPPTSIDDNVALLSDPNGWRQFLGQRLLVEAQSIEAESSVRDLLRNPQATTRLHALWTLDGLSRLTADDVILAMKDTHPQIRSDAIGLSRRWMDQDDVFRAVASHVSDPDKMVRLSSGMTLSDKPDSRATELLSQLALTDGDDRWFADALLTSTRTTSGDIIARLIANPSFADSGNADRVRLLSDLASIVGARGELEEVSGLLGVLGDERSGDWWRAAIVSGLGEGLPRYRGELGRLTLPKLLQQPPSPLAKPVGKVKRFFDRNRMIANDVNRDTNERAAAASVMAYQDFSDSAPTLQRLIRSDQPIEVQTASMAAITKHGSIEAAKILLDSWPQLGTTQRGPALDFLLRRTESTFLVLAAMADGTLNSSMLNIDQRVRLLKHSDAKIRAQAIRMFGGAVSSDRQQVAKEYEQALQLKASASAGAKVFTRVCAACHQIDGVGQNAGPSLSDVRNRSKAALLYDILDPNSKVEPRFTAYSVLTLDGQLFHGLIDSETPEAIVLKMAEGKVKTLGRAEIEQLKASQVSLMPEGIEKEITPQQMADLLEYLKARRPTSA